MEAFGLTRIHIQNLACFGDMELCPGASTLLLGRNGVGKSTLMDVLFALQELVNGGAGLETLPGYRLKPGLTSISLDLKSIRRNFRYTLVLQNQGDESAADGRVEEWRIFSEGLWEGEQKISWFEDGQYVADGATMALVQDRSPLSTVRFPPDSPIRLFKEWMGRLWLLRLEPRQMGATIESPDDALDVSGANFAAWFSQFRRRRRALQQIVAAAKTSVAGLTNLEVVRAGRASVLVARFGAQSVDFDNLSDGQRCLIVLHAVLVLALEDCSLLLLDEPDAHITPEQILPLLRMLQSGMEQAHAQLIVASHHPYVIDLMAPDQPWEMRREGDGVIAQPFALDRGSGISASRYLLLRGRS